jgi:curli production assembly/transport component CsgG
MTDSFEVRRRMGNIAKLSYVRGLAALLICAALAGCSGVAKQQLSAGIMPPVVNPITDVNRSLRELPPPSQKVVVAVYNYSDQTGQFKPSETTQTLSKAVTQGGTSILVKALQDVGNGSWFTVVERERIDNLLKERGIIAQMRAVYLGEKQVNPKALPPLLFAGVLFEGGIIGYDSNIQTGGVGARLLGIGGDIKYRLDTITVYLRVVSTKTGQVVASVTTHKTIASIGLQGGVFKYIAVDKILEAEAGFTKNEPEQLAVQQAIEKAVYAMVIEGSKENVWAFADKGAQDRLIGTFYEEDVALGPLATSKLADAGAATQPNAAPANAVAAAGSGESTTAALPAATTSNAAATGGASNGKAGGKTSLAPSAKPASAVPPWETSLTDRKAKQPLVMRESFRHSVTSK